MIVDSIEVGKGLCLEKVLETFYWKIKAFIVTLRLTGGCLIQQKRGSLG